MNLIIRNASVYSHGQFEKRELYISGSVFSASRPSEAEEMDAEGLMAVPGFIDVHTHGGAGVDVNHAFAGDFERLALFYASHGCTSALVSVLTDTYENTARCLREFARWRRLPHRGADLIGVHLEGPFLSAAYKGAMPEALLKAPDLGLVREYQRESGGAIRYITISPELPGACGLIRALNEMGVKAALGHSAAGYGDAMAAIEAGAAACTHTFNAMRLFHQHEPALMGAALESDIFCEAICDGLHLHPGAVRLLYKIKGEKMAAVTDSIMAAGLPDGEYALGVNAVTVKGGDARLKDGTRAGSTLTMLIAYKNLQKFLSCGPERALPLVTSSPAKLLGLERRIGSIAPGMNADCVLLKENDIVKTIVKGEIVYAADSVKASA